MLNKSFHIESSMRIVGKKTIQEYSNKSIPIKCAKYQIFRIWHTKHQKVPPPPWDVPNVIIFATHEQYRSIFGTVQMKMLKKKIYSFSLSTFMTFFCLSLSFSSFFLCHSLLLYHTLFLFSSSFFSRIFTSPLFFSFFLSLYASLSLSLLFFSFFCHVLSFFFFLHLDFCHWDQPSPWSSASPMRSTGGDRM